MQPGEYNFTLYEGEDYAETWTFAGITTAVGYSAAVDFREGPDEATTRWLGLTNGSGLTLSSDGTDLHMSIVITHSQTASMQQAAQALGRSKTFYDWKLTTPSGAILYPLAGAVSLRRRVTP